MTTPEAKARSIAAGSKLAHPAPGDEVVITGLAGRFPDSDNVYDFRDKMFNKVDLVSDDDRRWKLDHPEIPQRTGKINFVSKFDASFFGVHYKQAHTMDPMCRMLLERAYEAVVDAGLNPRHLKGKRCGVFIGACFSESEKTWFYEKIQVNGFGITGCSRAMMANRISYWLGVNGPSYTVDSACSSSLYALEHAYKSIRDGHCDMAIVGGANLCLHPYVSLQFARLGVLSPDGACKCFDNAANGYCRSEAITCVLLQKKKDAHRIYAQVVHAKTNCDGYKEQGITYPSGQMQHELLHEFYQECGIDPTTLNFVEAHGTGTKVGDPEECNALDQIFCTGRKETLLIGSVKSNIGHSEPASGLCSVTKVLIAMETGFIPPNIHFKTPREGIPAFTEGRMTVVTEKQPWKGGLAGVNSFGFGGANCHVLLKWNEKEKINGGAPVDNIPRLVCFSGRTEEAVRVLITDLESRKTDVEYVKLLHDVHAENIPGHIFRGFSLLTNTDRKINDVQYFPGEKRPIWFIFSGMGSQWPGMGKSLMKIPVFAAAIEKCHACLLGKGIDLKKIITDDDPKIFENILNCFVGIAAIQVGLVDILHTLGIYPDNIIGHSVGELGCAYADGCFTAEQMVLAAYSRGLASLETDFIRGSMAAVGMGYQKIKDVIPPEIAIACHNGPDSCTLSGPADVMKKYVAELTSQGVFAKEVQCSNIPYHSRYIAKAGPKLLNYLNKVIPHPKPRSSKWVSSSLPKSQWNTQLAKYSSAEYHTNNLLSPVLFEEASVHIPTNAITIEVAPHGLLQAILKRSLKKDTTHVALTQRGHADNTQVLLTGIGKLYEVGLQPQLSNLYPSVEFPVSRGTPMISPLVLWEHSEDWYVTSYRMQEKINSGERTVNISLNDEDLDYLTGHTIDGRNLYPATGYLALVWETLGMIKGELYTQIPVVFENVKFNRATNIPKEGYLEFHVMVQKGTGNFEIVEGGAAIVTGKAYVPTNVKKETVDLPLLEPTDDKEYLSMKSRDIYKELRLRGYQYSGLFKSLTSMDNSAKVGSISWQNNWVAFMDNVLQTAIIQEDTRSLYVPTSIQKLTVDPKKHLQILQNFDYDEEKLIPVYVYNDVDIIKCGGVELRKLKPSQIPRRKPLGEPVLEKYNFVPYISQNKNLDLLETLRMCCHIALENQPSIKVKVLEVVEESGDNEPELATPIVAAVLGDLPLIQAELVISASANNPRVKDLGPNITIEEKKLSGDQGCLLVISRNLLQKTETLQHTLGFVKQDSYIVTREPNNVDLNTDGLHVIVDQVVGDERILMLKKVAAFSIAPTILKISDKDNFAWIPIIQEHLKNPSTQALVLVVENEPLNGIIGLVNCLRKEPGGEIVRCVYVMDPTAPPFSISNPLYSQQLSKGLAINILKDGEWGSYRHQALQAIEEVEVEQTYLNTMVKGDLSSFKWLEGPMNGQLPPNRVVDIYYSSINFRDVMLSTAKLSADVVAKGRIQQELITGFEFAGRDQNGKRVMGMIEKGAMSTKLQMDSHLIWDVPDKWSLEEAATVPVVYGTVYYAFEVSGKMKKGDSVLIHSGTGGVGLAAINVAYFMGCTVFTTVGTPEKREYLKSLFPQLPDSHIGNSRDLSFEQMIRRETNGRGVDLVLNSLAEEKLQASIRCLAAGGRFLEIGKFDIANNNPLGMEMFMEERSFHGVMLDTLFTATPERKSYFQKLMQKAIDSGAVKPLKRTVFQYDEAEQAFRYMAAGKHMGKVILKIREEEQQKVVKSPKMLFRATPRFFCDPSATYIIAGGLGGFGLELADWLAVRGARKLVLTSRNGIKNGYQALRIRMWRSYDVKVEISTDDITTEEGVKNLLTLANKLGPVEAIFNLAVVLRDAIFENQTLEDFKISFGPKADATKHLDILSRKLCPNLKHFVIFSSVSCGRGNAGQTNYGMSNSVMERICEIRRAAGYPGLAVEWGAVGDVGLVADMQEDNQELVIGGTLQQTISSCLSCMDIFLKQNNPIVASMVVAEKRAAGSGSGDIVDTVVGIMGIRDLKTVSMHSSLAELGMDSMMAVEIKQTLEREFEVFLTPQDIRSLTFAKLHEIAEKQAAEVDLPDSGPVGKVQKLQGLEWILRLIGDESGAGQKILRLPSLAKPGPITPTNGPIFLIPGLEGMATIFEPLATNLKFPAYCLQYPYLEDIDTIQDIARMIVPILKSNLPLGVPYSILGYSTGTLIAIEVALLLELEGRSGRLFLIDGSPEFIKTLCKFAMEGEEDATVQLSLIIAIANMVHSGAVVSKYREDLEKLPTWDEKVTYVLDKAPPEFPHSRSYLLALFNALYRRIKAILKYDTKHITKLMTKVTLIRPTEQVLPLMPEEYNISKYCDQPVEVHFVEGNHISVLENSKTAEIINREAVNEEAVTFKAKLMSDSTAMTPLQNAGKTA